MMQIPCIHCGPRDESEFVCGGTSHIARPALESDDRTWGEYLFFRDNPKGWHLERWRHAYGCGQWFNRGAPHRDPRDTQRVRHRRPAAAMTSYRLPAPGGAAYRPLASVESFDSTARACSGFAGDTLASALLANGVQLVGRSFKLHRPRGIFSCGVEEPTGLVDVGAGAVRTPNRARDAASSCTRACARRASIAGRAWISIWARSTASSPRSCRPAFTTRPSSGPAGIWFEPSIRRMAGLGRAPDGARSRPLRGDIRRGRGAGDRRRRGRLVPRPRRRPRRARARCCVTSGSTFGGALGWRGDAEVGRLLEAAAARGVRLLPVRSAFGLYDHNLVCARESLADAAVGGAAAGAGRLRERLWKIRARAHRRGRGRVRASDDFSGQRPPGRDAGGRRRQVCARLRCRLRPARGHRREQRFGLSGGRVAARRRGERDRARRPARSSRHRCRRGRRAAASAGLKVFSEAGIAGVCGSQRGARLHRIVSAGGGAHRARMRCDLERGRARARRASALAGGRQAALARGFVDVRARRRGARIVERRARAPEYSHAMPRSSMHRAWARRSRAARLRRRPRWAAPARASPRDAGGVGPGRCRPRVVGQGTSIRRSAKRCDRRMMWRSPRRRITAPSSI